eukprot:scaffold931_cov383-Prasinococcus_capsulatus_cf.AAC.35
MRWVAMVVAELAVRGRRWLCFKPRDGRVQGQHAPTQVASQRHPLATGTEQTLSLLPCRCSRWLSDRLIGFVTSA